MMRQRTGTIIIVLLVILTLATITNVITTSRAQDPSIQKGFWFFKRPPLPQATKDMSIIEAENYLDRLNAQATWIIGESGITDISGNEILWTQGHVDAVQAEIVKITALIASLPR